MKTTSKRAFEEKHLNFPDSENLKEDVGSNVDYSILNCKYETPKNLNWILKQCDLKADTASTNGGCSLANNTLTNAHKSNPTFKTEYIRNKHSSSLMDYLNNSDISEFVDINIFDELYGGDKKCDNRAQIQNQRSNNTLMDTTETTLEKSEDLMCDSHCLDVLDIKIPGKATMQDLSLTHQPSGNIETTPQKSEDLRCGSPILRRYDKIKTLKTKIQNSFSQKTQINKPNLSKLKGNSSTNSDNGNLTTIENGQDELDFSEFALMDFVDSSVLDTFTKISSSEKNTHFEKPNYNEKSTKQNEINSNLLALEKPSEILANEKETNNEESCLSDLLNVSDICDLSLFGFKSSKRMNTNTLGLETHTGNNVDNSTFCVGNSEYNGIELKICEVGEQQIEEISLKAIVGETNIAKKPSSSEDFNLVTGTILKNKPFKKPKQTHFIKKTTPTKVCQQLCNNNSKSKEYNEITETITTHTISSDSENEFDVPVKKRNLHLHKATTCTKRRKILHVKDLKEMNTKKTTNKPQQVFLF